jgi:hypothetical protein
MGRVHTPRVHRSGWRYKAHRNTAVVALLLAAFLWMPALVLSACSDCGEFTGVQAFARMVVAYSPAWLLLIAVFSWRFRVAVLALAVASTAMAAVALLLATEWRSALEPLGLSTASGFGLFTVPYAVVGVAAMADLWPSGERTTH